jgi:HD superfamily phosphohydrolase YqeK
MRRISLIDLNRAIIEGISFTLIELTEENKLIITDTVDAYNDAILAIQNK